jgi:hypothetical protein
MHKNMKTINTYAARWLLAYDLSTARSCLPNLSALRSE